MSTKHRAARTKFFHNLSRWWGRCKKSIVKHLSEQPSIAEIIDDDEDMFEIGREPGQLPIESPFENLESAQFRVICYDESGYSLEEFTDVDSLSKYAEAQKGIVWVQMMGMKDPQLVHVVGALFNIPMLEQEDILIVWSRPKFEEYGEEFILAVARAVLLGVEEMQP